MAMMLFGTQRQYSREYFYPHAQRWHIYKYLMVQARPERPPTSAAPYVECNTLYWD